MIHVFNPKDEGISDFSELNKKIDIYIQNKENYFDCSKLPTLDVAKIVAEGLTTLESNVSLTSSEKDSLLECNTIPQKQN